jgi:N-methylhydantoinase A
VTALEGEKVAAADMYFVRSADMRYVGQEYTVNVPVAAGVDVDAVQQAFHAAHLTRYGHSTPGAPVEFVNLRLAALGRLARNELRFSPATGANAAETGRRAAIFDGVTHETPVLWRDSIGLDATYQGPLVIEEESATTVVPPGYSVRLDEWGNIIICADDLPEPQS